MEIWNEVCCPAGLAEAIKMPSGRAKGLAGRLKEDFGNDWDQWRAYCQRIASSEFLTGRASPGPDRDKPFKADIDWVLEPANLAKIVEGKYDDRSGGPNGSDEPYSGEYEHDLRQDYVRLRDWMERKFWMDDWGPPPGEPGCPIAAEVWAKYGPKSEGRSA